MNCSRENKGEVKHIAGMNERGYKDGPCETSLFYYPRGIDIDEQTGDIYIADYYNHTIRKISQGIPKF